MALIPDSILSDETIIFDELFQRFGDIDLVKMLVYLVDYVDASVLPHLAWQFHLTDNEGWQFATTDAERRRLIKKAIPAHKIKGKVKACKYILELLGFIVVQQEWHEYNGDPYHFKLNISGGVDVTDVATKINALIEEYKRASYILDSVNLNLNSQSTIPYIGGYGITGLYITGGA